MSTYLAAIQAEVLATFPDSTGVTAAQRSDLSTWLDTNIVPLVDVTKPFNECYESMKDLVNASNYGLLPEPKLHEIYDLGEFTLNLVIDDATEDIIIGAKQFLINNLRQIATGKPLFDVVLNTINDGTGVNSAYLGVGTSNITVPGLGSDTTKVMISISNGVTLAGFITAHLSSLDTITLTSVVWSKDPVLDSLIATNANDFITGATMRVYLKD